MVTGFLKIQELKLSEIKFFDRYTNKIEVEKVYGDKVVSWLYETPVGNMLSHIVCRKPISWAYGKFQDTEISKKKVPGFLDKFNLTLDEFLPTEGRSNSDPYGSFNEFFIRRFKEGRRSFGERNQLGAFSEARYFGDDQLDSETLFPVKGSYLKVEDLLGADNARDYIDGPFLIARLCPVDYHRFHYPDNGKVTDHYPLNGYFHSVNPMAIKARPDILVTNERYVTILDTENFGKLAYVEVGATCVGKIHQSHDLDSPFKKGDEKGYFLFGASTVIVVGEKGKWKISDDIRENSKKGIETYIKLGDEVGKNN